MKDLVSDFDAEKIRLLLLVAKGECTVPQVTKGGFFQHQSQTVNHP